jgi:hypothetical protein
MDGQPASLMSTSAWTMSMPDLPMERRSLRDAKLVAGEVWRAINEDCLAMNLIQAGSTGTVPDRDAAE